MLYITANKSISNIGNKNLIHLPIRKRKMNLDILKYFDETDSAGVQIFKLKDNERNNFFAKLPQAFRILYIPDEDLDWRLDNIETDKKTEILEKIPTLPHLQSGEFAEIFLFYFIPEKYAPNAFLRPPKWKWKEGKNHPPHYTDVLIFNQDNIQLPTTDDFVISVESKARATKPANGTSSLKLAILDAQKDHVGRLAESLVQISTKYKDEKDLDALGKLDRFIKVAKHPTFKKNFFAVAVVDNNYADAHIANMGAIPQDIKDSFQVLLVRISDLKNGYEKTYGEMPNT